MSKNDDVNHFRRLAFRHQEPPPKGSVFQRCLDFISIFCRRLVMGAAVFLLSLSSTGDRADYLRWMSLAPMGGLMLGGFAQVIRTVARYGIDRKKTEYAHLKRPSPAHQRLGFEY